MHRQFGGSWGFGNIRNQELPGPLGGLVCLGVEGLEKIAWLGCGYRKSPGARVSDWAFLVLGLCSDYTDIQ